MRAVGSGGSIWRVELVLWCRATSPAQEQELLDGVTSATTESDEAGLPYLADVDRAWSYDIQPPEPGVGVGVACWVRADSVGGAADTAWATVAPVAERVFGDPQPLWDLRVLPRSAILAAPSIGTPLTK